MIDLTDISLKLEEATGYDSIPTIANGYTCYEHEEMHECVYPGCHYRRRSSVEMWRHVHFGKHKDSFGVSWNKMIQMVTDGESEEVLRLAIKTNDEWIAKRNAP